MTRADLQATHATVSKIRDKLVALVQKGQGARDMKVRLYG